MRKIDKTIVSFDFNGTIVDDTDLWWDCVVEVFRKAGVQAPSIGVFIKALDQCNGIMEAYRLYGIRMTADKINDIYIAAYEKTIGNIALSSYAKETLRDLNKMGAVCYLVTWNVESLLTPLFNKFGLHQYFKAIFTQAGQKAEIIKRILQAETAKSENCFHVGDMPVDVVYARQAQVNSVVLLHRTVPKSLINEKNPDYQIKCLSELPQIIFDRIQKKPDD